MRVSLQRCCGFPAAEMLQQRRRDVLAYGPGGHRVTGDVADHTARVGAPVAVDGVGVRDVGGEKGHRGTAVVRGARRRGEFCG